jgi:DNA repair protein RecO (recombination protein O)
MAERRRVDRAAAFVLHAYPYSETSLLVEAFTRPHGRVPWLAKGARRAGSRLRGLLLAFQPMEASWSGRGEVRTLIRCEWLGGRPLLEGKQMFYAFYLNELVLRLVPREDPHESLFDCYADAVGRLGTETNPAPILRTFERRLLQEIGYGLVLDRIADAGAPVEADQLYDYELERGPIPIRGSNGPGESAVLRGRSLLAIARDDYADPVVAQDAKRLLQAAIDLRLDRRPLHTRAMLGELTRKRC